MRNKTKYILAILILSLFVSVLPAQVRAAAGNPLTNAYDPAEVAVFVNNKINVIVPKAYVTESGKVYIPVKTVGALTGVSLNTNNGIQVVSPKGTFKLDASNSFAYKNATYVTLEKFSAITGYSGKYAEKGSSVFFWDSYDEYLQTVTTINTLKTLSYNDSYYMGKKVLIYDTGKIGWVTKIGSSYGSFVDFTIQLADGTSIEESIYDGNYNAFSAYEDYEYFVNGYYTNTYVWANKNTLPYSNPLYHLEKVKILAVKLDGGELKYTVKRASGQTGTFKLPIGNYLASGIYDNFYFNDPKSTYPNWSAAVWQLIANQKIQIGMSEQQVYLSWGSPDDVSRYVSSYSKSSFWYYGKMSLYFYNGVLDSWSDY